MTTTEEAELWPHLAPDGESVVYASAAGGNMDIYVQRIGGHNATNLTRDSPAIDSQPAFSPDGSKIAFHSTRDGGGIFVMGATGESVRRLSDAGFNPAWSPDSRFIVVSDATFTTPNSRPQTASSRCFRWRTARDVSSRPAMPSSHRGRRTEAALPIGEPRRAAAGHLDDFRGWVDRADPVTSDLALDWSPVWAPDGRTLFFATDRAGTLNVVRVAIDEHTGRVTGTLEPVVVPSTSAGLQSRKAPHLIPIPDPPSRDKPKSPVPSPEPPVPCLRAHHRIRILVR